MKSIRIVNVNGMKQGKAALLTSATKQDRYRIGSVWYPLSTWQHGKQVDEVNHFGRHSTAIGDIINVKSIEGESVAQVKVLAIEMAEPERLADDDFQALGYASREEYMADWGSLFGQKTWLLRIKPIIH